jgi:serine/threonine protein phosphatase 1
LKGFVKRWFDGPEQAAEPIDAALEPGRRVYCIGDVHGRCDLLRELHGMIATDARGFDGHRTVVYLGDLIDRGMHSRDVVDLLLDEPLAGFEHVYLRGNHEQTLLDFMEFPEQAAGWLAWGGRETVLSYGVPLPPGLQRADPRAIRDALAMRLPDRHLGFYRDMAVYHEAGDYLFVHAGVRPGIPLQEQSDSDLMWIRQEFLESEEDHGRIVVHGHSITERVEMRPNRIGIDTGAFRSGVLTCLVLEGQERRLVQTGTRS